MRKFLLATHTHLAGGFNEVIELLSGSHDNVSRAQPGMSMETRNAEASRTGGRP
ncbi:MAG: hypothetical protein ACLTSX_02330 [Collinsella sp.]